MSGREDGLRCLEYRLESRVVAQSRRTRRVEILATHRPQRLGREDVVEAEGRRSVSRAVVPARFEPFVAVERTEDVVQTSRRKTSQHAPLRRVLSRDRRIPTAPTSTALPKRHERAVG